jgi:hypothetical protein
MRRRRRRIQPRISLAPYGAPNGLRGFCIFCAGGDIGYVSQPPDGSHVLTSWKEIATYLGKGLRTVQRWEHELSLPIRRPLNAQKHIVMALPAELDEWVRGRMLAKSAEGVPCRNTRAQTPNYATMIAEAQDQLRLARELRQDAERLRTAQAMLLNELRRRLKCLSSTAENRKARRVGRRTIAGIEGAGQTACICDCNCRAPV